MPLTLSDFMSTAFLRGCEASIFEIAGLFGVPLTEHPFEVSLKVEQTLATYGLVLVPPLPKGSPESRRLVCMPTAAASLDDVLVEIQQGEGPTVEFKSTFMHDVDRERAGAFSDFRELKSDNVIHACLKTICAFLNTDGGLLFVGVDDHGTPCGIEQDFPHLGSCENIDRWELAFRQHIQTKFYDGMAVNNFVRISYTTFEGRTIARVQMTPRTSPSYVKKASVYEVYVRQGNRTVSLNLPEFAEYLRARS